MLNKLGVEVTVREAGCCGALAHHIGESRAAHQSVRAALLAWREELERGDVDAIIANASGCGTMVKDYAHMVGDDPELADIARRVSALARDITEVLADLPLESIVETTAGTRRNHLSFTVAPARAENPRPADAAFREAGFEVRQPLELHLCCGSAGVYNILQPEMADGLRRRKLDNITRAGAPMVAAGNIGCIQQLDGDISVRHTIQYIDWASGGPPSFRTDGAGVRRTGRPISRYRRNHCPCRR